MSAAVYVGRVGALAVALGIGAAVAGVPGLAWADPEPGSDPTDSPGTSQGPSTDPGASPSNTDDKDRDGGGDSDAPNDPGGVDDPDDSAGSMNVDRMKVDSSGGAITFPRGKAGAKSNNRYRLTEPPKRPSLIKPRSPAAPASTAKTATQTVTVDQPSRGALVHLAPSGGALVKAPAPQFKQSVAAVVDFSASTRRSVVSSPVAVTMSAAAKPVVHTGVSRLLSLVTLSTPTAGDTTPVSTDSPLFAAFFAAGRHVSQKASVDDEMTARTVGSTQNSLMLAAVNSAPTAGTLDQTTGSVVGSLNGWTIASQPTSGTVTANGDTYTYTPTAAARLRAATTTLPDYDSFGVISSGQPATTVTVPIMPAVPSNQSAIPAAGQPALNNPTGLAVNGTYAYVANQGANTVSVVNIATGAVVKTITVGSQPSAVAISPTTKRAYVVNRASNTVSVVNTDTNTVVGSAIRVGTSPQDVAVNAAGTQVFVANNGSNNVSVVEPGLNNKVTTISLGFGNSAPTAIALSADGTRAYVTHRTITGGGAVSVINTSTKKVISTVAVGSTPTDVAVAGSNVYVANYGSGTVSVINTAANNGVTTINVGTKPSSLAVSPDGSMVVVARDDDNIAIIDTKTNTVIGSQHLIDTTTTPDAGHVVAFHSDARIVITDAYERTVRMVGFARGNTAPVATAQPTVGSPDPVNGNVIGDINISDPDQDPLKFTVSGVPAAMGSVTVDSIGTYTYSPSQAARDQAAQSDDADTVTFTVRATDTLEAFKDVTLTVPVLPTPVTTPGGVTATTTQIPLGAWPDFLATNGSRLYVLNAGESTVSVVDTTTNTVIQTSDQLPAGGAMTLSPDGKRLYVAEYMGDHIYVLDPETLQQSAPPIDVVTTYGGTLAVSPDSTRLYVGSTDVPVYYDEYGDPLYGESSAYVSVVDTASGTVLAQIPVGASVGNVELSPDGKLLYANAPDRVYVIDTATNTQAASFTVGGQPADVTFSPDSARAYITNLSSGELYVLDTATSAVIATPIIDTEDYRYFPELDYYHEAGFPTDLAMSQDGSRIYVARGDDVVVVDTATNSVVGTIRVATDIPNEGAQSLAIDESGTVYVTLEDTVVAVDVAQSGTQSSLALARGSTVSLMTMAAVANSAPTASPTMGKPDQITGQITGNVNAIDAEGNSLMYTVPASGAGAPTRGTVSVSGTGAFTYKPTAAARTAAGISAGPDFDTFTVTVSDGQGGATPVTVQVAVLPGVFENSNPPASTQANPSGVAIIGNRAYVANQGTNTVTVIDATTGAAVNNPIVVGTAPTGVAASPDGSKVYVANRTSGSVSVIRTSDNKVVNTITVGTQPESVTFSTDGKRAYVTNYGSKSVSVIDTTLATPKVIATISNVGTNPRGIAYVQTANGPRVYVANSGAGTVSVIDASTNRLIDTKPSTTLTVDPISVGSAPQQIAVSPDGTRIYVTNQNSNSVSVINTATNTLDGAAIAVGSKPAGVAVSADGSALYVANGDDSVSVVDTKTRTGFGVMALDGAPENNLHAIAVRSDGGLLVSDLADRAVRIVNYQRGNTAPVALTDPTVGNVDSSNGAISGNVNIQDWDGDSLTYSTGTAPARGTVTFDPVVGTYTYTPTQAARDAAAQTPGEDLDTFTIRATDPKNASATSALVVVTVLPSAKPPTNTSPSTPVKSADPFTGEVRGSVGPSGLSYAVISAPANGTVTVTPQGEYVYRPTQAARLAADQTPEADTDGFTVRITNGQTSTTVPVTVPVLPAQLTVDNQFTPVVGNGATGVDLNYRRAWIVNQADGTMTIITVPDGAPVATIPVGSSPTSVAFDGMAYAWVTNQADNTVSVVDLVYNPGAVTTLSGFNQPSAVLTDYPGLVFVANKGNGTVSVLNSSSRQVIRTFQVGQSPTAMALTGAHLYVANSGSNTVSMIDLDTNSVRATIPVGTAPTAVATSPNGTRVYVTNSDGTVSVIDAFTNTVIGSPVRVGMGPSSISVSPDGSLAYVANADDTVSVIDTRTNTVVRTVAIDPNPEMGSHSLVISQELTYPPRRPDGARIYITDTADKTVRAIALTPPARAEISATTTPVSVANPSATVTVGNRAYVATGDYNSYTNNVSVIDLDPTSPMYKQVIGTIAVSYMNGYYVPPSPAIVATRQGDRVFVTDPENNNVLAIDTSTNTVVDTYPVPVQQPEYYEAPNSVSDVILSGDGSRLYVSSTDGYIRAIDTASKSVVGTTLAGSDMAVSPDGRRLYVTGGEVISVYDTASMSKVGEIHVGPSQFDNSRLIAISADGSRAYVTGRVSVVEDANAGYFQGESIITDSAGNLWRVVGSYDVVSVIDISNPTSVSYNTEVATIPIIAGAWDVATSSDGMRVYVAASDGKTITVIDTATNAVIGQVTTDQSAGGIRSLSVGSNGTLYITDGYDGTVYAVTVGSVSV